MSAKPASVTSLADAPYVAHAQKLALATLRLQAQTYKAAMRYQIELLEFLKHRYEQDVKLVDGLSAREDFSDAFDVVAEFVQDAAAAYATEAGKVARIGSKLSSETARSVRRQADEMVEDLAAKTVG